VLQLLSASSGARIAGPDFDPFFAHSGGYGYTWFRDDAEISRFLLEAEQKLDLDVADWHARSARFYCGSQCDDGTWPHRVWADSGELAPGWAHGRLETGRDREYQADQTASVISFLAVYLRERDPADVEQIESALIDGFEGLDASLKADGLPEACQNAWENDTGRFTHTAATFLGAFAALARAPVAGHVRERARERAEAVAAGLDQLWCTDRGVFAAGLFDGVRNNRLDASTLALPAAHAEYGALVGGLDATRRRRLVGHLEATLDGLYRETDEIAGLVRFEGDPWRRRDQDSEKIWSVSTAWGAHAAAVLSSMLKSEAGHAVAFEARASQLLELVLPDGPLCLQSGYLAEQYFDDGTPDSATPLGWSHAIRLATVAHLET
jgi:GH15 family glucan-1,4-alpha-glucosidase